MEDSVPTQNFVTGFEVEERSYRWAILGFPYVRECRSMINSQMIDFTAGKVSGHPSECRIRLYEKMVDGKRWIAFSLQLRSPHPTNKILETSYVKLNCTIKNQAGEVIEDSGIGLIQTKWFKHVLGIGIADFIDPDSDDANFSPESLVINVTFTLLTPQPKSLAVLTEKFQVSFLKKKREDFVGILEIPDACSDIKIMSKDEKEFSMKKGYLAARSEVLAGMLRSGSVEGNSGVVELSEISSKALEVFLSFLKTGVLLPEWSETGVILELTNAAGKFELTDLLQFLDVAMGKVCQLENVLALAALARRWSLKVAEEELMMFARKEGASSLDNLMRMCRTTECPWIGSVPTVTAAASKGRKRNRQQR